MNESLCHWFILSIIIPYIPLLIYIYLSFYSYSCLSTFLSLNQSFPPSVCPNTLNSSCPIECSIQLNTTLHTTGCCFSILNNTAYGDPNITGPYEYMYWTQCGVPVPETCEFDYNTVLSDGSNVVSTITLMLYSLIFVAFIVYICILC